MQGRFRIQSFSSQSDSHPVTNLLAKHSPWESERFCDYPQEITLAFYHPVRIHAIRIAAHPTKIPSRINILYHLPKHDEKGFVKYGFVTFSEGDSGGSNPVEVKELIEVGVDALEVRFLLLRNHMNKHNFFNQVALSSLSFTTSPCDHVLPPAPTPSMARSALLSLQPQVSLFQQLKANFVRREQFQEAKQVKQILGVLQRAGNRLEALEGEKQRLVKGEDFMGAKKTKEEMAQYKQEVTELLTNFYDPDKKVLRSVKSDEKLRKKIEQLNLMKNSSVLSDGSEPNTPHSSRIREQPEVLKQQMETVSEGELGEQQEQGLGEQRNESMISYEERILPAVMSRIKGMGQTQPIPESSEIGDNQFFESGENKALPAQPQPMGPADEANSSLLTQFYDQTFIRKLHSKHWQFRLQAITQVLSEVKQTSSAPSLAPLQKNRLRCFLFIYSLSLKSHNFQIASATLETMNQLAPLKPQGEFKGELHNQLENALRGTLKKLGDSNQKVRSMAEKTILRIIDSPLFGVALCYSALLKSYPEKTIPKIRRTKIEQIQYMVERYGVGEGAVPYSVTQFALRAAGDPDADVRKSAAGLGKTVKERGGKQRLDSLIMGSSMVKTSPKKIPH